MVKSIALVSLGNGVGKTTISLNLALALQKLGYKVLLFDADFTKKNLVEHLDIQTVPTHIGHVFDGDAHMHDAIYTHLSGLKIVPSFVHNYDTLSYHYQDLLGDYDYIILDTPSQPENLSIVLENVDEAFIVHSPEHSSKIVMDAADMLSRVKVLNLGVILNHSLERSTSELFGNPVVEKIPPDKDIAKSFAQRNLVVHVYPKGQAANTFYRLARRLG